MSELTNNRIYHNYYIVKSNERFNLKEATKLLRRNYIVLENKITKREVSDKIIYTVPYIGGE